MYIRINTITGSRDIDAGLKALEEIVVPAVRQQKGYRGLSCSADRAAGILGVITVWDTLADLEASESAAAKVRQQSLTEVGGEVDVRIAEELVAEVGTPPPAPGCALRLMSVTIERGTLDEHAEFFRREVLPTIRATPGFRGVRFMADRGTGEAMVGAVWSDLAAAKALESGDPQRIADAAGHGVRLALIGYREVLYIDQP